MKQAYLILILVLLFIITACEKKTNGQMGKSNNNSIQSKDDYLDNDILHPAENIFLVCGDFVFPYRWKSNNKYRELVFEYGINHFLYTIDEVDSLRAKYGLKPNEYFSFKDLNTFFYLNPEDYITITDENNQEFKLNYVTLTHFNKRYQVNERIVYASPSKQTIKLSNGYFSKAKVPEINLPLSEYVQYERRRKEKYTSLGDTLTKMVYVDQGTLFKLPEHSSVDYITFSREGLDTLLKDINKQLIQTDIPYIYKLK